MRHPSPAHRLDIGAAIDNAPWNAFQKLTLGLIALAFFVDGIANQALGLAIPALVAEWQVSRAAFASVAGAGLIGVTIGAALGGMLGDRFGRRSGLIGSVLVFGAMTFAAAYVDTLNQLLVVRFFDGLGIGAALPNGAALIAELAPKKHRSMAIALGMVWIGVGGLMASLLAAVVLAELGWRGYFMIAGAVPLALTFAFVAWLPESPLFLARRPHRRPALLKLLRRLQIDAAEDCEFVDNTPPHQRTPLGTLLEAGMRRNTFALWAGFFFCMLGSYTMFSWAPTMLSTRGLDVSQTSFGMSAFNLGGVVGGLLGGWLLDRIGSRVSMLGLAAGAAIGALILGALSLIDSRSFEILLVALLFAGVCLGGLTNGVYALAAHIYPPFAKATGVGAAAAAGRIGAVISSYTGVLALQLGGASGYFLVIAVAEILAFIAIAAIRHHVPRSVP